MKKLIRKRRISINLFLAFISFLSIYLSTAFNHVDAAPLTWSTDGAASVAISSESIIVGGTGTTDITVNSYSGAIGLGAYDVHVHFDPAKIKVVNIAGGDGPFSGTPTNNSITANTTGSLSVSAFQTTVPGPTGPNILLARITWQGLAAGVHLLNLAITTLGDVNGGDVHGPSGPPSFPQDIDGSVAVNAPPVTSFSKTLNPANGVAPCTVTFTDTSTGAPHMWYWSFGDGSNSSSQNPFKTYNTGGNYTVTLTATNTNGSNSTSQTVSIFSAPVANFTASPRFANPGTPIAFTDTSSGNIATWLWNFGDSTTSSTPNPTKSFVTEGNYDITLSVTNPAGTDTVIKTGYISIVNYKAEIAVSHGTDPNAYIGARIARLFNPATGATVTLAEGISAFDAYMSYSASGVTMKAATGMGPFATPAIGLNSASGTRTTVIHSQTGASPQPPLEVFRIYPWLTGSKDAAYTISLHFNTLTLTGAKEAPLPTDITRTFRRGDANNDGTVNITDALLIAQHLAGLREVGESSGQIWAINAATPKNDSDTAGSSIVITDALYIAQMLAGLRDASYVMVS